MNKTPARQRFMLLLLLLTVFAVSVSGNGLIHPDKLKRGMKGYGLTVFAGTAIERFQVTVIGVLHNTSDGGDLILARLSGGPLQKTGVIAGMSGSPVYINGKLAGAVAYAWGFSKSTICGIQPIGQMMRTFDFKKSSQKPPFKMTPSGPTKVNGQQVASINRSSFRPVATPLICSGFHPSVFEKVITPLKSSGFLPVLGGDAAKTVQDSATNIKLEPGAAIGVQLVSGDLNVTGIGTVTYTGPEGVLAFGHPMMRRGFSSFPMTTAWIHTVMPSLQVSFKMGSALQQKGAIFQDRDAAIAGSYKLKPDMVPVKINFNQPGMPQTMNFKMIRDDLLFPKLFSSIVLNALVSKSAAQGRLSYKLHYQFRLKNKQTGKRYTVSFQDAWASFKSALSYQTALGSLIYPVQMLLMNRYSDVILEDIDLNITAEPQIRAVEITDLRCDKKKIRPGEAVSLKVELTPFRGSPFWKKVELKVPESTINGKILFVVSSAAHEQYYNFLFAPGRVQTASLQGLVDIANQSRSSSDLAVWSELARTGLKSGDRMFPNLPGSLYRMFKESKMPKLSDLNSRLKKLYKTNYFLYGLKFIILEMDHSPYTIQ